MAYGEELRKLTRRVTGLEVAVANIQSALAGIMHALETRADPESATCSLCGDNISAKVTCEFDLCPCGIESELEEENES